MVVNGSAAHTVLLVGPPRPHRDHVTRVLAAKWPVVSLDHEGAALRYLGGLAERGTPCAVLVVLCDTLPEAQARWEALKPAAQSCNTPVLLVVASQDLLPGWESLADDVVCGAWEPALLHQRVTVLQRHHHLRLELAAERKRARAARLRDKGQIVLGEWLGRQAGGTIVAALERAGASVGAGASGAEAALPARTPQFAQVALTRVPASRADGDNVLARVTGSDGRRLLAEAIL